MKNELPKNSDQYDESAKSELRLALGKNNPFEYIEVLDAERMFKKPRVVHVKYNPHGHSLPEHFGVWPEELALENDPVIKIGKWVEEPEPEQHLVVKIQGLTYKKQGRERAALLKTNSLFSPQQDTRPLRLFGYGLVEKDNQIGYLLLEHIDDSQFIQLDKYFPLGKTYPVEEVIDLAVGHASVLDATHGAGLNHNDLEGPGAREHIYWNPKNRALRIIDWQDTDIVGSVCPPDRGSYAIGQTGIGQILMWGLTGNNFRADTYEQLLTDYVPHRIQADIQKIIELSIGVNARSINSSYPLSPRGTRWLYNDLLGIQRQLNKREVNNQL